MEITQGKAENDHPENHSNVLRRAYPETQTNRPRLAQLLPNGKYLRQTKRVGWVAAQPSEVLHLASLEEARTEKEELDSIGH